MGNAAYQATTTADGGVTTHAITYRDQTFSFTSDDCERGDVTCVKDGEAIPSRARQRASRRGTQDMNTSQEGTNTSQEDTNTSQEDTNTSQEGTNTSQEDMNTSQEDMNTSQEDMNTSQDDMNTSQDTSQDTPPPPPPCESFEDVTDAPCEESTDGKGLRDSKRNIGERCTHGDAVLEKGQVIKEPCDRDCEGAFQRRADALCHPDMDIYYMPDGGAPSVYKVTQRALGNGEACPHADGEERHDEACVPDVACEGQWEKTSGCKRKGNSREGTFTETYRVTKPKKGNGAPCLHDHGNEKETPCTPSIDCEGNVSFGTCVCPSRSTTQGSKKYWRKTVPQRRRQGLSRSERRPLDEGRHCQRHSTLLRMPRGLQRRDGYRLGRLLENLRRRPADADGDALAKARERWHAVPGSSRADAAGRHDLRRHAELQHASLQRGLHLPLGRQNLMSVRLWGGSIAVQKEAEAGCHKAAQGNGTCPGIYGEERTLDCSGAVECTETGFTQICDPKTKFRSIRMTAGENKKYSKAEYAYKIGVCKGIDLEHWKRLGCDASGFMHTSPYTTSLPPAFQAKKGKSYYVGTIGTMATDQAAGNEEVKIEMRTWNDRFGGRWNTVIPEKTLEATPECQSDRRNSICKVQWHQSAGCSICHGRGSRN